MSLELLQLTMTTTARGTSCSPKRNRRSDGKEKGTSGRAGETAAYPLRARGSKEGREQGQAEQASRTSRDPGLQGDHEEERLTGSTTHCASSPVSASSARSSPSPG